MSCLLNDEILEQFTIIFVPRRSLVETNHGGKATCLPSLDLGGHLVGPKRFRRHRWHPHARYALLAATRRWGCLEPFCFLPADPGPCEALIVRWYFNSTSGECEQFTYGGCEGNENNFETRVECQRACRTGPALRHHAHSGDALRRLRVCGLLRESVRLSSVRWLPGCVVRS